MNVRAKITLIPITQPRDVKGERHQEGVRPRGLKHARQSKRSTPSSAREKGEGLYL